MWDVVENNLPMNNISYRYIAGYFNKKNRPIFYKRYGMAKIKTNHYWDAEKFNSIKKCVAVYGDGCKIFKLNFEFKIEVQSA